MPEHGHLSDTMHQNAAMRVLSTSASHLFSKRSLVGAVGIEFAVNLTSPTDSVVLAPNIPAKTQLNGLVLWPRCGQISRARSP
jgi:hypothetical protein